MAGNAPTQVTVRTYDVGFGDCLLLTFHYAARDRHLLIDFGTMRLPEGKTVASGYIDRIAQQIKSDCGGKLDLVVATHRHQDHISGFSRKNGRGPGEVIRNLKPSLVIQPWTEDPRAAADATSPALRTLHLRTLTGMQAMAGHAVQMARNLGGPLAPARERIMAIGMDNIKNEDAVRNLQTMAPNRYVHYGMPLDLSAILPGVKTTVLGPPTVAQTQSILRQRQEDPDEFWHLNAAFWLRQLRTAGRHGLKAKPLFPKKYQARLPWAARWFRTFAMRERAESLLSIVRTVDNAMNNTSVILLFEVNGKRLLFPGDAQFENWMYALGKAEVRKILKGVDLYKVGHHGSLNATPKTLWNGFAKKSRRMKAGRLLTFLSTLPGVHGAEENRTEVPRNTLVNALKKNSVLVSTAAYRPGELVRAVTIPL